MSSDVVIKTTDWQRDGQSIEQVRRAVFVVEQSVPDAEEWDAADHECIHVLAQLSGDVVGTGRLESNGKIGRMAVLESARDHGVGSAMMNALLNLARDQGLETVFLNAQVHAIPFYGRYGFKPEGTDFDEAGIPHRLMRCVLEK